MNDLVIKNKRLVIEISEFDKSKELYFECDSSYGWLTVDEVNKIITHLANCLKEIDEPIEI